ncbi:MAG: DUF4349 domain-containing protein [Chloroflexota bacterium]
MTTTEGSVVVPAPAPAPGGIKIGAPPPVITIPPTTVTTSPSFSSESNAGVAVSDAAQSPDIERRIVRTGDMSLLVDDVAGAIDQIARSTDSYNGYVVTSSSWKDGERLVGNISVRVPADRFDDAMRAFSSLAVEVTSETTSSQDVTEEYIDLSAQLNNLEATEAQLLVIMAKAEKVEDILAVQHELSNVRGNIEQTKGRMQYLERTSDTSLITVWLEQAKLDVKFTASYATVKTGVDVRFSAQVGGGLSPYSFQWDFGDGSTSTDANPRHAYRSPGTYDVSLAVADDRGNTDTEKRDGYVTVIPDWDAGNIASSAWSGFVTFGKVLADVLIWAGIFSPVWIVIGGLFWWWRRRRNRAKGAS